MYLMSMDVATAFVVQAIVDAQKCYIPASVPHCCQLTVWRNRYCHHTYRAKMRAWESGDQNHYLCAKQIARCTQARVLAIYKQKLVEKLSQGSNDHVWWKMTRSLNGLSKSSRRATPDVNVLGNFFASKLSLSDDFDVGLPVLPQELRDVKFKSSWRVQISKICCVLKNLDVDKAVQPSPRILHNCYLHGALSPYHYVVPPYM